MTRYAILDAADGALVNVVEWDGGDSWSPPEGTVAVLADECDPQIFVSEVPSPSSVSARQIRLWLVANGIGLEAVDAAIGTIPDAQQRDMVRVEWEYAPYVERSHPMLIPLAAALGMTEGQVDAAFREAATL